MRSQTLRERALVSRTPHRSEAGCWRTEYTHRFAPLRVAIFGDDDVIAGAVLDRLLHHSHVIAINGPSYRTKDKRPPKQGST
jgi:hypothetical protein